MQLLLTTQGNNASSHRYAISSTAFLLFSNFLISLLISPLTEGVLTEPNERQVSTFPKKTFGYGEQVNKSVKLKVKRPESLRAAPD